MEIVLFYEYLTKKGVPVTQGFGDFTEDDAYDDDLYLENLDVEAAEKLQQRFDEVNVIPTTDERRIAVKDLIRELNGDDSGPVLVT